MTPQIIEIQPLCAGWQVREAPESQNPPFFTGLFAFEHAISFAWEKTTSREGEIRVLARSGEVITTMPFGGTRQRREHGSGHYIVKKISKPKPETSQRIPNRKSAAKLSR